MGGPADLSGKFGGGAGSFTAPGALCLNEGRAFSWLEGGNPGRGPGEPLFDVLDGGGGGTRP